MSDDINTASLKAIAELYRGDLPILFGALSAIDRTYRGVEFPKEAVAAWEALNRDLHSKRAVVDGLDRVIMDALVQSGT